MMMIEKAMIVIKIIIIIIIIIYIIIIIIIFSTCFQLHTMVKRIQKLNH